MAPDKMLRTISIAPMMECTDRHFRYFLRKITRHALLYTEMVPVNALYHGDWKRFLEFHAFEKPLALQIGGSDPEHLSYCARLIEDQGYDEINLNVGCPSARVQKGRFGACLMAEPDLVAGCIEAMAKSVSIPITVKTRIGIDDRDSYENLVDFVTTVSNSGCEVFIVHARKALLGRLSPKKNREIPPLRYDFVHRLKSDFPYLQIILNGGIRSLTQANFELESVDGVMIGRQAYQNPYLLSQVDKIFYQDDHPILSRHDVLKSYLGYVETQVQRGVRLPLICKHICGLFHGTNGARAWRRYLSENINRNDDELSALIQAAQLVLESP